MRRCTAIPQYFKLTTSSEPAITSLSDARMVKEIQDTSLMLLMDIAAVDESHRMTQPMASLSSATAAAANPHGMEFTNLHATATAGCTSIEPGTDDMRSSLGQAILTSANHELEATGAAEIIDDDAGSETSDCVCGSVASLSSTDSESSDGEGRFLDIAYDKLAIDAPTAADDELAFGSAVIPDLDAREHEHELEPEPIVVLPLNNLRFIAHSNLALDSQLYDSIRMLQWKYMSVTSDYWYRALLRMNITREDIMSADRVRRKAEKLTHDIVPVAIDCCVNSCMAFTEPTSFDTANADDGEEPDSCTYCGEPRYEWLNSNTGGRVRRSRKTFVYIPLIPRLQLQYANKDRAALLQNYPSSMTQSTPTAGQVLRDFWDGSHYTKLKGQGYFNDPRTLAFQFSTDGVSLVRQKNFSLWPIILINYNLPPTERVKTKNIIVLGFVPGPTHPKDMDSFLVPLVDEMLSLKRGIRSYDASKAEEFVLYAHITTVTGDFPAIAMLMRMKGPNGKYPCRYCKICGSYCKLSKHYYYPHTCDDIKAYCGSNLARSDMIKDMHLVAAAKRKELQTETGYSGLSILLQLEHSIYFPESFALDPMHLLSNVSSLLYSHWTAGRGSTMPKSKFHDDDDDEVPDEAEPEKSYVLSKAMINALGDNIKDSRGYVPTAIARSPRSIAKHQGSYKAKEWETFLFLFSTPLLLGRLPEYAMRHWQLLVSAFRLLYKNTNSHSEIDEVENLLQRFVVGYEKIYYNNDPERLKACTSQIHSLLHLSENVRLFGPVFGFWQFPLERYVGTLERLATSKSQINKSLSNSLIYRERFNYLFLMYNMPEPEWEDVVPAADESDMEIDKVYKIDDHFSLLGSSKTDKAPSQQILDLLAGYLRLKGVELLEWNPANCSTWSRLQLNGKIIGSKLSLKEGEFFRKNNICEIQSYNARTGQRFYRHCLIDRFFMYRAPESPVICCALVRQFEEKFDSTVNLAYIVRATSYTIVNVKSIERLVGVVSQSHIDGKWNRQAHIDSMNARWFVALEHDINR